MKKVLTASCLCKGVKFKTLNKLRSVSNCHCVQCRKTHGIFGAYTNIKDKEIKFLNKTTLKWFKSSKNSKRGFCNKCGASIFFKVIGTKNISIAAGMFNKPVKLKTIMNIFIKGKLEYYKLDYHIPKFKRYPKGVK